MPGPGFNQVFGGGPVQPAQPSYSALTLAANTTLALAAQAPTGAPVLARIMDITPSGAGFALALPAANAQGLGSDLLITNRGATSFNLTTSTGGVIATIAPGQQYYVYLTDNTTVAGTWLVLLFGAGSSNLSAATVAGTGMLAVGSAISPNFVSATSSASPLNINGVTDRAGQYVWLGGAGVVNLPAINGLPAPLGFFVIINNKGTGALTITPSGADSVDSGATATLNPGYNAAYFATASGWFSFGVASVNKFAFTQLVQTVTGGTLTLTQTQAANVVQKYQGTLTSNQTVVFPAIVQVYYVQNATSGAFNLTFKSGAGTTVTVPSGQNAVLFSDGTNVINASTTVAGLTSLLLGSGSPTTPAIGFSSDPSTGIYQSAAGHLSFTISGTQRFDLTASALLLTGVALTAASIQSTPIGSTTPASGAFTSLNTTGALTVGTNLTVSGALAGPLATGGFKITGLGAPSANGDALAWGSSASVNNLTVAGALAAALSAGGFKITSLGTPTTQGDGLAWGAAAQLAQVSLVSIAAPAAAPIGTPSTTGGTVGAGSYYAKVVAVDALGGLSAASAESGLVTTTGTTSSISWTWPAVAGATSYRLYVGSTPGGESSYFTSSTASLVQTTTTGTAGTPPTAATSGGLSVNGQVTLSAAGASIGPNATIGAGATLGNNVILGTGATIGANAVLSTNTTYSDGTTTAEIGWRGLPGNSPAAAYTLVATDRGRRIRAAGTITIPAGVFNADDVVTIVNITAGSVSIVAAVGVTLRLAGTANTGNRTLSQRGVATLICDVANDFYASGAGLT